MHVANKIANDGKNSRGNNNNICMKLNVFIVLNHDVSSIYTKKCFHLCFQFVGLNSCNMVAWLAMRREKNTYKSNSRMNIVYQKYMYIYKGERESERERERERERGGGEREIRIQIISENLYGSKQHTCYVTESLLSYSAFHGISYDSSTTTDLCIVPLQ